TNGVGSIVQSGGNNMMFQSLIMGAALSSASVGTYTLSGGTLSAFGENISESFSSSGTASFNQSGGVNSTETINIGYDTGGAGTYTLIAGTVTASGFSSFAGVLLGELGGTGVMNVSGGTATFDRIIIYDGSAPAPAGARFN